MARNFDYVMPSQGRMAKQQLARMIMDASALYRTLEDDDRLPAWVLLKVNTAEDRLHMASDYIRYKAKPVINAYGYPGVTGRILPDTGAVNKTVIDGKPYLCVSYETEQNTVQPLRLAAGLVAGPLVVYAASKIGDEDRTLRMAAQVAGAAVSIWSLWVWNKANTAMQETP